MEKSDVPQIFNEKCPECGSETLIDDRDSGETSCGKCGLVLVERKINRGQEWRAFDSDQIMIRAHAEVDKGLPTQIGPHYNARGRPIPPSFQTRRLEKWQSRSAMQKSAKRNLQIATQELDRLSGVLAIPPTVKKEAMMIYRRALEMGSVRGRSIDGIVPAALYAACRKYQIPRSLSAISKKSKADKKEIARNYRLLIKKLKLRQPITDYSIYIIKVAGKLDLPLAIQEKAFKILKEAKERGLTAGKGPQGLAAAALYIACDTTSEKRTQKAIADEAEITEVTIRNRYKDLKDKLGLSQTFPSRSEE